MNIHFERNPDAGRQDFVAPLKAYAQIERIEPESVGYPCTVSLDAISADWLAKAAAAQNDFFSFDDPTRMINSWSKYWKLAIRRLPNGNTVFTPTPNPLEKAELYRIDVTLPYGGSHLRTLRRLWGAEIETLEKIWFVCEFHAHTIPPSALRCQLYYNAFTPPVTIFATITVLNSSSSTAIGLSRLATLDDLPTLDTNEFADELKSAGGAEYLAAYDVGQGNSNALLNPDITSNYRPTLYFDVGCGVYANQGTTPAPLSFCFNWKPLIVLSHWDCDHWMGVCLPGTASQTTGLGLQWIAPKQTITTHHKTFVLDIIAKGGSLRIYDPMLHTIGTAVLSVNERIRFTRGERAGRNHSGIVLSVEKYMLGGWKSWLLTGDCDYRYFRHLGVHEAVAVVVPHHGANPVTKSPPPAATSVYGSTGYTRAVYSFGPGNTQSGVRHPTPLAVARHHGSGWSHGGSWATNPGSNQPLGNTLATSHHSPPNTRGGCIVGWATAPSAGGVNCGCGCGSSTSLTQS
jgi:hypothetical protein